MKKRLIMAAAALACLTHLGSAGAAYPDRAIRVVVPFEAGGLNDILARIIGPALSDELKQTVVVENKGGAGTNIGTDYVARAKPDGYTLLLSSASLAINPTLYKKLSYNVERDFEPIIQISTTQMVVLRSPKLEVNSVKELIDEIKKNPGGLNYESSGTGSPSHLAAALFLDTYGLEALHIPYKGSGAGLLSIAAGDTQFGVDVLPTALTNHKAGTLKILAIVGDSRFPAIPDVPTLAEAGYPEFSGGSWNVIMAPAGTPAEALNTLRTALKKVMESDAIRQRLIELAVKPEARTGPELKQFIKDETAKWGKVITEAGISAN